MGIGTSGKAVDPEAGGTVGGLLCAAAVVVAEVCACADAIDVGLVLGVGTGGLADVDEESAMTGMGETVECIRQLD